MAVIVKKNELERYLRSHKCNKTYKQKIFLYAGRNTGIQPLHKGCRLWIKTTFHCI